MRDRNGTGPVVSWLASGLGAGRIPRAPGTAGALVGLAYWWLLARGADATVYWLVTAAGIGLAVWAADRVVRRTGERDPAWVVIDELAVLPIALAGVGDARLAEVALGFLLFRLFDIWKPFPIARLQDLPGGWGVVADDVLAAVYACALRLMLVAGWTAWGPVRP